MQKSNSQYDSFLFWRQPIPELDLSELKELGLTDGLSTNGIAGKDPIVKGRDSSRNKRDLEESSGEDTEEVVRTITQQS
uniref:Protein AF1q n=1 Tax=Gouania willdenowi TaxID=441366 RepID=A0A8C5HQV2_GOUWI